MKRKAFVVADAMIGVLLLISLLATGSYGIDADDRAGVETALRTQPYLDSLGFDGFQLADYPVAVFDGNKEYVLFDEKVESRTPILGTLTGTAYEVEGHYEVFVPNKKDFSMLLAAPNHGEPFIDAMYAATICHEAFHAWQFTYFGAQIEQMANLAGAENPTQVLAELDADARYRSWFEQEQELLLQAVQAKDTSETQAILQQWLAHTETLSLNADAQKVTAYYELVEGSAQYVEAKVFMELSDETMYNEYYMQSVGYSNDAAKYYTSGMLKCLLLDELLPAWQTDFDCSLGMNQLLKTALER